MQQRRPNALPATRFPRLADKEPGLTSTTRNLTLRHSVIAMRSRGGTQSEICARSLSPTGGGSAASISIRICGRSDRIVQGSLRALFKLLRGGVLHHFAQPEAVELLLRLTGDGNATPGLDLQVLAEEALERRSIDAQEITIDELAARHGLARARALEARTCPRAAVHLIADLYRALLHPQIEARERLPDRTLASFNPFRVASDDLCSLAAGSDPIPSLPLGVAPPPGGWRHGEWDVDEALDCALRFRAGADLLALSRLTRRSPRAIRARLRLAGIVA